MSVSPPLFNLERIKKGEKIKGKKNHGYFAFIIRSLIVTSNSNGMDQEIKLASWLAGWLAGLLAGKQRKK